MKSIEQIREEETAKMNAKIEKAVKENTFEELTGFKLTAFDTFSTIDLSELKLSEIKPALLKIMKHYKPNKTKTGIEGASNKWDHLSWFRLDIENNIQQKDYATLKFYNDELFTVWIKLPLEYYSDYLRREERKLTSSEYHYFTGVSQRKLNEMKISRQTIRGVFDLISWYGGNTTLYCKNEEEKEAYNHFVLNGTIV